MWHTYISSPDTPDNDWRLYGVRAARGEVLPSYHAFKLLTSELIPFERVEKLSGNPSDVNSYKIFTQKGSVAYAVWGSGSFSVPGGVSRMTSVIPQDDGSYAWTEARPGEDVSLAQEPLLMK
jgi:hypothetical protein